MGEFGWAYISCESEPEVANGPTGSLQFHSGSKLLSGSSNLTFLPSTNTLNLTGTFNLSGTINANQMNINVVNKAVVNISASGDTKFGDTIDDIHQFTGSLKVKGGSTFNYKKLTASSYTVLTTDYIIGISSSNYVSITLPSASIAGSGSHFIFKDEWCSFNTGSGGGRPTGSLIAISASGADTIDGNGNYEIKEGNNAAISLYSNGANGWWVF
jgi:hypothetical protein